MFPFLFKIILKDVKDVFFKKVPNYLILEYNKKRTSLNIKLFKRKKH